MYPRLRYHQELGAFEPQHSCRAFFTQSDRGVVEPFAICHHNYVDTEDRIIRKGAIRAHEGDLCIIPPEHA